MKRRKFIQVSSLLTVGALFTQKLSAQPEGLDCMTGFTGDNYYSSDKKDKFRLIITMCMGSISFFEQATDEEKIFSLQLYSMGETQDDLTFIFDAKYKITSALARANDTSLYDVVTEQIEILKPCTTLPADVNWKDFSFTFRFTNQDPAYKLEVYDNKSFNFITLYRDEYEDCFITSACVNAMNKTDDCAELSSLRQFRDSHLQTTEAGRNLVKEYYAIAPNIVQNINKQANSFPIYANIYNKMIQPTLRYIEQEEYEKAIEVYKNYTYTLKAAYFNEN